MAASGTSGWIFNRDGENGGSTMTGVTGVHLDTITVSWKNTECDILREMSDLFCASDWLGLFF